MRRLLQDRGCRTIALVEHSDVFARRLKPLTVAITGDEIKKKFDTGASYVESIARLLSEVNEVYVKWGHGGLKGELPRGAEICAPGFFCRNGCRLPIKCIRPFHCPVEASRQDAPIGMR